MVGFDTDLQDLRDSSRSLGLAADAAEAAAAAVHTLDVPVASSGGGAFDLIASLPPATAFGRTLGMPEVAKAYEAHRKLIEGLLLRLWESTAYTSRALEKVAELYEGADQDARAGAQRAAAGLSEH